MLERLLGQQWTPLTDNLVTLHTLKLCCESQVFVPSVLRALLEYAELEFEDQQASAGPVGHSLDRNKLRPVLASEWLWDPRF